MGRGDVGEREGEKWKLKEEREERKREGGERDEEWVRRMEKRRGRERERDEKGRKCEGKDRICTQNGVKVK